MPGRGEGRLHLLSGEGRGRHLEGEQPADAVAGGVGRRGGDGEGRLAARDEGGCEFVRHDDGWLVFETVIPAAMRVR